MTAAMELYQFATELGDRKLSEPGDDITSKLMHADVEGEARLAEKSVSVRCLQRADGSVPVSRDEPDLVAVVGRSY